MRCLPCGSTSSPLPLITLNLRPGLAGPRVMHAPGHWQLHARTVLRWDWLQVLDEIGVDLGATMGAAPRTKIAQKQQEASSSRNDQETEDLVARLAALR